MMKKTAFAMVSVAALTACVLPPQDVTEQDLLNFDAAVASIDCKLEAESDYLPVELQTGLVRAKVIEIAQYRVAQEQAVSLPSGGVQLITGRCAPTAPTQTAQTG